MVLALRNLTETDSSIMLQHRAWAKKQAASLPAHIREFIDTCPDEAFSVLQHPGLWSGARFLETKIKPFEVDTRLTDDQPKESEPFADLIANYISQARADQEADKQALTRFKKHHKRYLEALIEKSLLQALNHSLDQIYYSDCNIQKFRDFFNTNFALTLHTRSDSLRIHAMISQLTRRVKRHNSLTSNATAALKQVEVLAKRLVDIHIDRVKKTTPTEEAINSIATGSSIVGLATGIPAAILGIAGIFVPPLLVPATILGVISLISYVATIVSTAKMSYEGIVYQRAPSAKEVLATAIDAAIAPLNFLGGSIASSVKNTVGHAKKFFELAGSIWNNIGSNILPDIFYADDVFKEAKELVTSASTLKHTTTATSWKNILSGLLTHNDTEHALALKHKTKESLKLAKETDKSAPSLGRSFAYVCIPKQGKSLPNGEVLQSIDSMHDRILTWDKGFFSTGTSQKAKNVVAAVNSYMKLSSHSFPELRLKYLSSIQEACKLYLKDDNNLSSRRYEYVKKLLSSTCTEIDNIKKLRVDANEELVLVGYKNN